MTQKRIIASVVVLTAVGIAIYGIKNTNRMPPKIFRDSFNIPMTLQETNSMATTTSPWRLSSGGMFFSRDGIAQTLQGDLEESSPWHQAYAESNPTDTDGGVHPQNIFRLQTIGTWKNFTQEAYFRVDHNNLSNSPNRNSSNGLFFFNRAKNQNNLYYTGLRVDGLAVIKKKVNGEYVTLVEKKLFDGEYDRIDNPNVLPQNTWMGLKSEVRDAPGNTVNIQLFIADQTGNWKLVAEATDSGDPVFTEPGYAGIRIDFIDVSFEGYSIEGD